MDFLLILTGLIVGIGIYILGRERGKKVGWSPAYYKGRAEGWAACETLLLERMVKSKNLDLTKREILDEFIC